MWLSELGELVHALLCALLVKFEILFLFLVELLSLQSVALVFARGQIDSFYLWFNFIVLLLGLVELIAALEDAFNKKYQTAEISEVL